MSQGTRVCKWPRRSRPLCTANRGPDPAAIVASRHSSSVASKSFSPAPNPTFTRTVTNPTTCSRRRAFGDRHPLYRFGGAGDREERGGGHGQGDVGVPGVVAADLVLAQAGLVLRGL